MLGNYIHYGLLVALAIGLLFAAFTDTRSRRIDNWLNAAIALGAPAFWWASGLSLWPGVVIQIATALVVFSILAGMFALRLMGGGDVKLLAALALWVQPLHFLQLLFVMALAGGLLSLVLGIWHVARRQRDRLSVPYGIAIAIGGLWVLSIHHFPQAGAPLGLTAGVG